MKFKFLDFIIGVALILCVAGGLVAVVFQWCTGQELSPTLIQMWFTVFGVELLATAAITITKSVVKIKEKKYELDTMDKRNIEPAKEDIKLKGNSGFEYDGGYYESDYLG